MEITAIFEAWHVGDGNYPPLSVGQAVRLSFELQPSSLAPEQEPGESHVEHLGHAEYRGIARVLRRYPNDCGALLVLEVGGLRFYVCSDDISLESGDLVAFAGTLLLDHYAWVERRHTYHDAPDLFYKLRVARIGRVTVPESFVARNSHAKTLPTRVGPGDFEEVEELMTMEGQAFDEEFFVIDFSSVGLEDADIPLTFRNG